MSQPLIIYLIAVSVNLAGMLAIYSLMAFALARLGWRRRGVVAVLATIVAAEIFWIIPAMIGSGHSLAARPASYSLCFGNWLVSAFGIIIFCQTARKIPRGLEDSARLDGCGWWGTYWHIVLPLVRRELGLIALLTVMATALPFWVTLTVPGSDPLLPLFAFIDGWRGGSAPGGTGAMGGIVPAYMALVSFIMALPVIALFFLVTRFQARSLLEEDRHPLS